VAHEGATRPFVVAKAHRFGPFDATAVPRAFEQVSHHLHPQRRGPWRASCWRKVTGSGPLPIGRWIGCKPFNQLDDLKALRWRKSEESLQQAKTFDR